MQRTSLPTRIAVVTQGDPTDPRTWSGSPAGVCSGLEDLGVEVVPVDARPRVGTAFGRLTRRPWTWQASNSLFAGASSLKAELAVRRRVDGVVAIGSGFRVRGRAPVVSFDDETLAQALRQDDCYVDHVSAAGIDRWLRRQRRIYESAQACCVGSEWAGSSIRTDYGIDPAKIEVVGFGRNLDPPPSDRDWSTPRFLFLGVNWELKRGPAVLRAFAAVRRLHPDATLDLCGEHPDIDAPGVTGHGRLMLGSPDDRATLEALLSGCTCLVVPSKREAFGIAYVDAGAAGMPSIGTTVGGAPETIGDGGLVVAPGDEEGLRDAMLEMCDPEIARRRGEAALVRAQRFTWKAVSQRMLLALAPAGAERDPSVDEPITVEAPLEVAPATV